MTTSSLPQPWFGGDATALMVTMPLAVAAAAPPLEPPDECARFQGFRVGPP